MGSATERCRLRCGAAPPAALGVEGAGRVLAVGADVEKIIDSAKLAFVPTV